MQPVKTHLNRCVELCTSVLVGLSLMLALLLAGKAHLESTGGSTLEPITTVVAALHYAD